ncbi:GNAT family N-acetyltransferase [Winogradskya humida]|uniref:N-acetyltransferase n=1 Tax=Winogradskya humida TaxID=113566 RepID=A0ABQ4A1Q3_9ACTN|nr:GNAT family N-acetyltransferase [Actinoplanes humidus]GIE24768.1 N-acetyltransferase [Actinoplanes humidus]
MIRVAGPSVADIEEIAALAAEADVFYGDVRNDPLEERRSQIHEALFSEDYFAHMLLAWDGDNLVGFATYSFLWPAAGLTRSLFLKELFVSASARRRRVGTLLMQTVFEVAKRSKCSRVEWQTEADNGIARSFYARFGGGELNGKVLYRMSLPPG